MTPTKSAAKDVNGQAESIIADAARRAEEVVRESVETLRAQTRAYADTAAQRLDTAQKVVVEHVKEKPLQSTAIAVGVGVVIGLLLARRH
jgi:ElaB/YqjD/DUF883 family membrane-anchored ribosome-binding protein